MADVHTKEQRSYNMSMIRAKNTKPEIFLRRILFAEGLRGYRIHYSLPGKPDIVFCKHRLAVFIDGCYWHKCPKCFVKPQTNSSFWMKKIGSNVRRDRTVNLALKKDGWKVIRIWEHEARDTKIIKRKVIEKIRYVRENNKNS